MITQLEKEFIMSQAMKYRRFESGADKIGYIYITQLEELLNSGQEVDAVRRNEDAQSDAVGSINKTEKAEEQPAGEPTAEERTYIIRLSDKVNSILVAALRELNEEQMICLRDALIERTPANIEAGKILYPLELQMVVLDFIAWLESMMTVVKKSLHNQIKDKIKKLKEYQFSQPTPVAWTNELVLEFAKQYRFSSSRISIEMFMAGKHFPISKEPAFTLDDMLDCWEAGNDWTVAAVVDHDHKKYPDKKQYFKEKYGYDLSAVGNKTD